MAFVYAVLAGDVTITTKGEVGVPRRGVYAYPVGNSHTLRADDATFVGLVDGMLIGLEDFPVLAFGPLADGLG